MTKTILVVDDEERMEPRPVALVDDRGQVVMGGLGFQNDQQSTVDQYEKGEPIESMARSRRHFLHQFTCHELVGQFSIRPAKGDNMIEMSGIIQ